MGRCRSQQHVTLTRWKARSCCTWGCICWVGKAFSAWWWTWHDEQRFGAAVVLVFKLALRFSDFPAHSSENHLFSCRSWKTNFISYKESMCWDCCVFSQHERDRVSGMSCGLLGVNRREPGGAFQPWGAGASRPELWTPQGGGRWSHPCCPRGFCKICLERHNSAGRIFVTTGQPWDSYQEM